jgi:hypothetical protein
MRAGSVQSAPSRHLGPDSNPVDGGLRDLQPTYPLEVTSGTPSNSLVWRQAAKFRELCVIKLSINVYFSSTYAYRKMAGQTCTCITSNPLTDINYRNMFSVSFIAFCVCFISVGACKLIPSGERRSGKALGGNQKLFVATSSGMARMGEKRSQRSINFVLLRAPCSDLTQWFAETQGLADDLCDSLFPKSTLR